MDFYDEIASQYDVIVDSARRQETFDALANRMAEDFGVATVLDVACGTGHFARAMAAAGACVTAADISAGMLAQAREIGGDRADTINWVHAPMQEIAAHVSPPLDLVCCMGNSLPHLQTNDELVSTLGAFRSLLADGGMVLIHVLNYDSILAERERIVGVSRHGDTEYVRFYDFLPAKLQFNVLELKFDGDRCSHQLHQTVLMPYTQADLTSALRQVGFTDIQAFADLTLQAPCTSSSDQVVLLARG